MITNVIIKDYDGSGSGVVYGVTEEQLKLLRSLRDDGFIQIQPAVYRDLTNQTP